MSDEPRIPEPFAAPHTPRAATPSWTRPLLYGCGTVALLLGIALVVFLFNADHVFRWGLAQLEEQVMENLPEGTSEETRRRLATAFPAAADAVAEAEADPQELQKLQAKVLDLSGRPSGDWTVEDVEELATALERVAGIAGEGAAPEDAGAGEGAPPPPASPGGGEAGEAAGDAA